MSHLNPGLISAYNSLTDKHLSGYFNNTRIRRHLQRVGLITRSGRIVPDREYRHKLMQKAQQRHVRECLAQAIFHKVLEMERAHQIEIKRKLEEFARRERVHKIKVERSKRYEEEVIHILSPRPPTGPKVGRARHYGPEGEHSESSESPGSSRPNTAPGKMQRPVRLKPIHSNSTTASQRRKTPYRHHHESSNDTDPAFNYTVDGDPGRRRTLTEFSAGVSPYCLPVINNFVTPVPPPTRKKDRGPKLTASGTLRGRRLRPTTAPGGPDINEESPMLRTTVHQTGVLVNMVFYGKTVHLSHDLMDMRDEVKVFQQHCGGENLCVYKGKLHEGGSFQFVSRRHRGFPFSLTLYLNGLQVERLSSCCEFKHRKGSRLGGRNGHFGVSSVKGASPCYKCIIAMGLDKNPTAPPKRAREQAGRGVIHSPTEGPEDITDMDREKTSPVSSPDTARAENMEYKVKEELVHEEEKPKDDYEEDFEADDEDTKVKEKNSPSLASHKEKEEKETEASHSEDDVHEEDRRSGVDSSYSDGDREGEDESPQDTTEDQTAEAPQDAVEDDREPASPSPENKDDPTTEDQTAEVSHDPMDVPCEGDREPVPLSPDNKDDSKTEDSKAPERRLPSLLQTTAQESRGESTGRYELEALDNSPPSGNGAKENGDPSARGKEADKVEDGITQEEEPERAKSVQEKLADAILLPAQCSSEPELSDTSTEEEEASIHKDHQNKDSAPDKFVTFVTEQHIHSDEDKCEDNAPAISNEEVNRGETTSEEKAQEGGTNLELQENLDRTTDEIQDKEEEVEKDELVIDHTENLKKDESEKVDETEKAPHHEIEGKISEDPTNQPANPTGTVAEEKADEREGVPITEEERQSNEIEQEADSRKGESLAPELMEMGHETAGGGVAVVDMKTDGFLEEPGALSCEETPVSDTDKEGDDSQPEVPAEGRNKMTDDAEKTSEAKAEDESIEADIKEESMRDESPQADVVKTEEGQQDNQMTDKEENEKEAETQNKELNREEAMADEEVKHEDSNTGDKETAERENMEDEESPRQDIVEEGKKDDNKVEDTSEDKSDEDDGNAEENVNEELLEGKSEKTIPDEAENGEADQSQKDEEVNKTVEPVTTTDKTAEGDRSSEEQADKKPGEEVERANEALNHSSDGNPVETEDGAKDDAVDRTNVDPITEDNAEELSANATESENVEREVQEESGGSEKGLIDIENGEMEAVEIQKNSEKEEDDAAATQDENDTGVMENVAEDLIQSKPDIRESAEDIADNSVDKAPNTEEVEMESKAEDAGTEDKEVSTHSDSKVDKLYNTLQNGTNVHSCVEEDNKADTEEASKPSEDGISVVLKPQVESSQCIHVDGNHLTESSALDPEPEDTIEHDVATPESLEREDNRVLVTNWVTLHQTSKFFEKFIEPLDDWNEFPHTKTSPYQNTQEIESTNGAEVARSSPSKIVKISEHEADEGNIEKEVESTQNTGDESKNNKVELVPPDIGCSNSKCAEPCESEATKYILKVQEDHLVTDFTLITDTDVKGFTETREEEIGSEHQGTSGSLEKPNDQETQKKRVYENTDISKTEVVSIEGSHHLVASVPDNGTENQQEEVTINTDPELNENQTELENLQSLHKGEEYQGPPETLEGLSNLASVDMKPEEHEETKEGSEKKEEDSTELTEVTDFTLTSKAEDDCEGDSQNGYFPAKTSGGSITRDNKDVEDIEHNLSKD